MCAHEPRQGGISLQAVPQQLAALQAKVIGRLLQPEQLPSMVYFRNWLYRSNKCMDLQKAAR